MHPHISRSKFMTYAWPVQCHAGLARGSAVPVDATTFSSTIRHQQVCKPKLSSSSSGGQRRGANARHHICKQVHVFRNLKLRTPTLLGCRSCVQQRIALGCRHIGMSVHAYHNWHSHFPIVQASRGATRCPWTQPRSATRSRASRSSATCTAASLAASSCAAPTSSPSRPCTCLRGGGRASSPSTGFEL